VDHLVEPGGRAAGTVAEAVRESDVVITMLPDSPDVAEVALGEDGVLAHARDGLLFIDCSTIRPEVSRDVAEAARERGVRALDAPVSGGQAGAVEGALSVMVGGDEAAFAAARPVLDAVGKTIVHVGPAGAGQTVKAANQLIVAGTLELVAEAIVFLEAHGVDTEGNPFSLWQSDESAPVTRKGTTATTFGSSGAAGGLSERVTINPPAATAASPAAVIPSASRGGWWVVARAMGSANGTNIPSAPINDAA
jgi:3-hydroxyisobutyrate dehydrogenase-like beta-hydroxyacid dehydrogenase